MSKRTETTSNTILAVLGKDDLKENKVEGPNEDDLALDNNLLKASLLDVV